MDYALEHARRENAEERELNAINHVRMFKRIILPCELVRFKGRQETKEFRDVLEVSSVPWKVLFNSIPKPHKKLKQT